MTPQDKSNRKVVNGKKKKEEKRLVFTKGAKILKHGVRCSNCHLDILYFYDEIPANKEKVKLITFK